MFTATITAREPGTTKTHRLHAQVVETRTTKVIDSLDFECEDMTEVLAVLGARLEQLHAQWLDVAAAQMFVGKQISITTAGVVKTGRP